MNMSLLVLLLVLSLCGRGAAAENGNYTKSYSLRLVGGNSRCQGRLQMQRAGQDWTEVRPGNGNPLGFAHRACAELDCGPVLSVKEKRLSEREAVGLKPPNCLDFSLINCFDFYTSHSDLSLELNCSDSARMVGGRSLCSGSPQIQDQSVAQSWAGVCEGALDRRGAEVLCRELDCGPPLLQGALSPLKQKFYCEGNESKLMDCNQTRTEPETCPTLYLTCAELRLVGGASRCEGVMEVKLREEWRRVELYDRSYHSVPWDLEAAAAVCRDMDCGSAVSTEVRRGSDRTEVWGVDPYCVKTRSAVGDCVDRGYSSVSTNHLLVVCSDSARQVGGRRCSGSLQIQDQSLAQSWAGVCEGALDRRGAEVLCRELGCGPPLLQGALSPLKQKFYCEGNESKLMDCPRTTTGPETCPTLNLTCTELRLVGGASRCEGTVEVLHRRKWRRVKPSYSSSAYVPSVPWDLEAAAAVCRDLDCGSPVSTEERRGFNMSKVWTVRTLCVKGSSAVSGCVHDESSSDSRLLVVCSDSVRLVGGRRCSGSLQIQDQSFAQSWAGVCEGALDLCGAEVLCRELDCGPPLLHGALSPQRQTFHCEGNESKLMDCPRTTTGPETCPTLNLTCTELRLVGGASRCEGTVEVLHGGEWGRVEPYDPWDLEAAAGVCRDMDCGSAVSTEERRESDLSTGWFVRTKCVKSSAVGDCVDYDRLSFSTHRLLVVCSDLLKVPEVSVSEGVWAPRAEGELWGPRAQEGEWASPGEGGAWVQMGAHFRVKCSVEPQYPGGSFQLLSPTLNLTLPAVNHSAHFLFTDVGPAHKGSYTCVYLLQVFNHSFTSSSSLYIHPGVSDFQTLVRVLVLLLLMPLNFIPYFFYRQATRGRVRAQRARRRRARPEEGEEEERTDVVFDQM